MSTSQQKGLGGYEECAPGQHGVPGPPMIPGHLGSQRRKQTVCWKAWQKRKRCWQPNSSAMMISRCLIFENCCQEGEGLDCPVKAALEEIGKVMSCSHFHFRVYSWRKRRIALFERENCPQHPPWRTPGCTEVGCTASLCTSCDPTWKTSPWRGPGWRPPPKDKGSLPASHPGVRGKRCQA